MTELLLIRHGLPLAGVDPGLGIEGRRQAARLAARLRHGGLVAVYSSPLARAVQTASPLVAATGLELRIDDGLAEWDRDAGAYVSVEELRATGDPRWTAMLAGDLAALGVDVVAFRARVEEALARIVEAHPNGRVAVVCHGGVINVATAAVIGIDRPLWFEPRYTSVSTVAVGRSGRRAIGAVNDAAHLETPGHGATDR